MPMSKTYEVETEATALKSMFKCLLMDLIFYINGSLSFIFDMYVNEEFSQIFLMFK